jgi:hypothetical protein
MRFLVCCLVALASSGAIAREGGNEDTGGGDVVWAGDAHYRPVLLDFYVGQELGYFDGFRDLSEGLGASLAESEHTKALRVIRRVARFDGALAARAEELLAFFEAHASVVDGPLAAEDDENLEVRLPAGLHLYQTARWTSDEQGQLMSWEIDGSIWALLDSRQRAGLMLHEVFYVLHNERRHGAAGGAQNARYLRQFIASIACGFFTTFEQADWDGMMAAFRLF